MSAFQIQQFTRIRDDPCDQSVQNKESVAPGSYQMTNLVPASSDAFNIAYQQPAMLAAAGYGWSAAQINADSVLRNHAVQTNSPHAPIRSRVQSRPFMSVPYMGRGKGEADVETKLQQPSFSRQSKDTGTISDTFYQNQFTPMLPHVSANIQNPANLIPEVASAGWMRSGIPSRQWVRDQNSNWLLKTWHIYTIQQQTYSHLKCFLFLHCLYFSIWCSKIMYTIKPVFYNRVIKE